MACREGIIDTQSHSHISTSFGLNACISFIFAVNRIKEKKINCSTMFKRIRYKVTT